MSMSGTFLLQGTSGLPVYQPFYIVSCFEIVQTYNLVTLLLFKEYFWVCELIYIFYMNDNDYRCYHMQHIFRLPKKKTLLLKCTCVLK